jgi:hypothetical protein
MIAIKDKDADVRKAVEYRLKTAQKKAG